MMMTATMMAIVIMNYDGDDEGYDDEMSMSMAMTVSNVIMTMTMTRMKMTMITMIMAMMASKFMTSIKAPRTSSQPLRTMSYGQLGLLSTAVTAFLFSNW